MTTIKIYYKDVPGQNLISSKDGARVWTRNIRSISNDYKSTIFPLLDLLGTDYEFSSDKNDIVLIDVGSLHPGSVEFFNICKSASEDYPKAVIFSMQEPWQWIHIEPILNSFSNLFLLDSRIPLADNKTFHPRYGNFPAFLCRSFSPRLHVTMCFSDDLGHNREYKKLYSCLLARWRVEKHLLFSMLAYNNLLDKGYVTFNPLLNPHEEEFLSSEAERNAKIKNLNDAIDILMPQTSKNFKDFTKQGLVDFEPFKLSNDITIDEAQFADKITGRDSLKWFDPVLRAQPKFIFEESCFSLICESFSGIAIGQDTDGFFQPIDARAYISEKTITPIMNGHPWLVFGEAGFNSTMESYGFAPHDEMFDLSFDRYTSHGSRLDAIKNNLVRMDLAQVSRTLSYHQSETNKKIRHNKHNLFHTQSKMWKTLRSDMMNIFDRIRDFNV